MGLALFINIFLETSAILALAKNAAEHFVSLIEKQVWS
jgi:hypothetical protein